MFKKLIRRFNEQILGFVYYEMNVASNKYYYYGEIWTNDDNKLVTGRDQDEIERRMKEVINCFYGTPINKIKFVIKYV